MMRLVPAMILVLLLGFCAAENSTADNTNDLNSIETTPSVRIDPYIRKALLKALSELEDSNNVAIDGEVPSDATNTHSETHSESTESPKEEIKIHSFVVDGQSAFSNDSYETATFLDNKVSILSSTTGNVENQITATFPTKVALDEILQTRESGTNVQQVRSIQSTRASEENSINGKFTSVTPKPSTTTTTTTTTTTPRPTHDHEGLNIEKVNKEDVQVFQSPLVAAFTVQQDAQGRPNKVTPIYQQTNAVDIVRPLPNTNLVTGVLPPESIGLNLAVRTANINNDNRSDFINEQVVLQKQLEEKQRILEEQLRFLQIHQRQQEELLRRQQFLLQQKDSQRQQQIYEQELKRQQFLAEQQRIQANQVVNSLPFQGLRQNQFFGQNNIVRSQSPQVAIQPSVSLETNSINPSSQQQLPNREAVDFLIHLRNQQPDQFPLQENHLPQGISNFLQPTPVLNVRQPNFNQLLLQDDTLRQKHGNRVFRQEAGVGNFGVNNQNFNRFNSFRQTLNNRFIPGNRFGSNSDVELQQLLIQSGLNGRSQEDLNIVSKVLSLNHGIPFNNNVFTNRLPFDNRRSVRV